MCDTVHIAVLSRDKQHSASHVVQQQSQSQRPLTTLESAGSTEKEIEKGTCSRERENRTKIVFPKKFVRTQKYIFDTNCLV